MLRKTLSFATILLALVVVARGQNSRSTDQDTDKARIERLVGLAKVWGTVKYFHPYLAYRDIDWDKALIETIPRVNAAKTPLEYSAAINHLLSFLNDKSTYAVVSDGARPQAQAKSDGREFMRLENGVFYIDPVGAAEARMLSQDTFSQVIEKNSPLVAGARAIIIDGRDGGGVHEDIFDYYLQDFNDNVLKQLLDGSVPLGAYRYRMHNGYATQIGTSSGGYYSAMVTTAPEAFTGQSKTRMIPTFVLVNGQTPISPTLLSGLQAAKKVVMVQDGASTIETGSKPFEIKLPNDVSVKMRTAELVNPDGSIGFQPDEIVPHLATGDGAMKEAERLAGGGALQGDRQPSPTTSPGLITPKEKAYAEMAFPNSEYRLLALFRFWNVINYFGPYKHLSDRPWNDVLAAYIPKFEANKDAGDYQSTARHMVAEIQDSHGFVRNTPAAAKKWGKFLPPFNIKFIEGQAAVDHVFENFKDVKVGDAILAVNGEPIEKVMDRNARYIAASTPQALARDIYPGLLRGQENDVLELRVRGVDGSIRDVRVLLTVTGDDPRWAALTKEDPTLPVSTVLPSGFGYVDLGRLEVTDVDRMFETIRNTPGTIFDMRGYPNGTAWAIAPRLTERTNIPAALFSNPIWEGMKLGESDYANGTSFTFTQYLPERKGDVYKGKVVMLINEYSQSQAEHTALFFEAATNVTFVGTPTAGANGDVTRTVLPGNIEVTFSGHDVRHADGRQLQRVGILPTIRVAPTIRGLLIEKRDEVLEAAIRFLQLDQNKQQRKN